MPERIFFLTLLCEICQLLARRMAINPVEGDTVIEQLKK